LSRLRSRLADVRHERGLEISELESRISTAEIDREAFAAAYLKMDGGAPGDFEVIDKHGRSCGGFKFTIEDPKTAPKVIGTLIGSPIVEKPSSDPAMSFFFGNLVHHNNA
jgi:hypothetical protein